MSSGQRSEDPRATPNRGRPSLAEACAKIHAEQLAFYSHQLPATARSKKNTKNDKKPKKKGESQGRESVSSPFFTETPDPRWDITPPNNMIGDPIPFPSTGRKTKFHRPSTATSSNPFTPSANANPALASSANIKTSKPRIILHLSPPPSDPASSDPASFLRSSIENNSDDDLFRDFDFEFPNSGPSPPILGSALLESDYQSPTSRRKIHHHHDAGAKFPTSGPNPPILSSAFLESHYQSHTSRRKIHHHGTGAEKPSAYPFQIDNASDNGQVYCFEGTHPRTMRRQYRMYRGAFGDFDWNETSVEKRVRERGEREGLVGGWRLTGRLQRLDDTGLDVNGLWRVEGRNEHGLPYYTDDVPADKRDDWRREPGCKQQ